jgi:hypothetical protein
MQVEQDLRHSMDQVAVVCCDDVASANRAGNLAWIVLVDYHQFIALTSHHVTDGLG